MAILQDLKCESEALGTVIELLNHQIRLLRRTLYRDRLTDSLVTLTSLKSRLDDEITELEADNVA